MKKFIVLITSTLLVLIMFGALEAVQADPPIIPSSFYGEVQFAPGDFAPTPGTTQIDAYTDSGVTPAASVTITQPGTSMIYAINVPGNTTDPQPTTVIFKIADRIVATANWASGTNVSLDIHPPSPDVGGPYVGAADEAIALSASAADLGGDVTAYVWDLDDDGFFDDAFVANPTHIFGAGVHPIAVKVTDGQGGEGFAKTDVIAIELSGLTGQVYDGTAKSVTITDVGTYTTHVTYAGSADPPTNAGTYAIVVTVKDHEGTEIGTLTGYDLLIAPRPITVTAVADTKIYDGDVNSGGIPTLSEPLVGGDTGNWSQSFDDKHAGSSKTLTPSGTITDGNNGANYDITFLSVSTGAITPIPLTVTALTDTKIYDGTTASTVVPTLSEPLVGGDTGDWSQSFDDKHSGINKTITPSGTITDGNNGANYNITLVPVTTGVIQVRPLTVTAVTETKEYDGTTDSSGVPTLSEPLVGVDTGIWSQSFDDKHADTGKTLIPDGTITDGNSGNNYAVTFVNDNTGVIIRRPITVTADAKTKVFGSDDPALTYTYTGNVVAGDGFSGLLSRESGQDIGVYAILQGNLTLGSNYTITFVSASFTITPVEHVIDLVVGWNLVSFNLQPESTVIGDVLASIAGKYDLVYAWDASGAHSESGNWMKYDPDAFTGNTLDTLDPSMGFWIHMTAADSLTVEGSFQTSTTINLLDDVGGWNLVGFPSAGSVSMPEALETNGVSETDYSLVYAYHATDGDQWKLYDTGAPPFANDLVNMDPGYGYWIFVTGDPIWTLNYQLN